MPELEEKLQIMLKTTEDSQAKLKEYNEQLKHLYIRLQEISVSHRRKTAITDTSFEDDFRQKVQEICTLSDVNTAFWKDIRLEYHNKYKKDINQDYRFLIKQISISARSFTRQTDDLFTIYKNLQTLGADLPLRLNWWMLENASQELLNTTNRILFLVRNMEKHYA